MRRAVGAAIVGAVFCGCRPAGTPEAALRSGPVVGRWGAIEVTVGDLDARILGLPAASRPRPGADLDEWYEQQVRETVVERRLAREAREAKLEESAEFVSARREAERLIAVELCVSRRLPEVEAPGEGDLRAAYAARAASFSVPERRATFHLFLRAGPDAERSTARARIEDIRDRVLGGESFRSLAARYSDSETRRRDGAVGWLVRGQLPAGFEKVVFGLEEGVPSEPVVTRDGVHLFYVEQILPGRQLTYEEVQAPLRERLVRERRQSALEEIEAGIEAPPGALLLDREDLAGVTRSDDSGRVVLRVGDYELDLRGLRQRARRAREDLPLERRTVAPEALAWEVLQQLRRREILYQHCRAEGTIPEGELAERLDQWRERALPALQRRRRMLELVKRDESRLKLFYESNAGQFSDPPSWHLRRLRVPLDGHGTAIMARLEAVGGQPGTLDEVQAALGGEIEDLGTRGLAELRRLEPKLPPLVAPLRPGELSAPYRTAAGLEIVEVLGKTDASARSYDAVREEVAAAYVAQYSHDVYRTLTDEILGAAELQILPEGLRAVRETGLARPDASVEELEALFDELLSEGIITPP